MFYIMMIGVGGESAATNIVSYGPFSDEAAVQRYCNKNSIKTDNCLIVPLHDSGDCLDA